MELQVVNGLNKSQLLNLFDEKDIGDKNKKRDFFSDVFYDFATWPKNYLQDFWLIRRVNRMRITNFCFGNGLNIETLREMLEFYHSQNADNRRRINEIIMLWDRLVNNMVPHYYYYNMQLGFEIYFGGQRRKNGKPAGEVNFNQTFRAENLCDVNVFDKPKVFEIKVRNRIIHSENERWNARQELLKKAEKKKDFKETLKYLKLNSIEDLFIDNINN